jgi:hypothetical protein
VGIIVVETCPPVMKSSCIPQCNPNAAEEIQLKSNQNQVKTSRNFDFKASFSK